MRESPIASYLRRRHLPLQATPVRLLGVETMLLPTGDGGDLYVTWDGLHRLDYLLLENWLEPAWFQAKRERLPGTSTVYRLPTKPVNGHSIDLVVKYSRVGEDVSLDTMAFNAEMDGLDRDASRNFSNSSWRLRYYRGVGDLRILDEFDRISAACVLYHACAPRVDAIVLIMTGCLFVRVGPAMRSRSFDST